MRNINSLILLGVVLATGGLKDAVEDHTLVEAWGNKIITVSLRK